jgi:dUTP pyrophosphatase
MKLKVKYFDPDLIRIEQKEGSDWLDLRASKDIYIGPMEYKLIPMGVAIELPPGYEAHIAPRSSTFKNYGILQVNSVGVVDELFKGNSDEWFMPVLGTRDAKIKKNDRICQFRIVEKQPKLEIEEVEFLENPDRGGHGSTGTK